MDPKIGKITRAIHAFFLIFFLAMAAPDVPTASPSDSSPASDEVISVDAVRNLQLKKTDFLLFDARDKRSYDAAHIEGARLPLTAKDYNDFALFEEKILSVAPDADEALKASMKKYPKDKKIVTYCNRDCRASAVLLLKLKKLGFRDVRAMEEGFQAWEEKGYPVQRSAA